MPDDRKLVKTQTPGIFRRGNRYVVVFRAAGRQRKEYARTYAEARRLKSARQTDVSRGEFQEQSRITFGEYAEAWVDAYMGSGRGFRERTREDYRRDLKRYAIPFLGGQRMTDIRRADVRKWIAWLVDDEAQAKRHAKENADRAASGLRELRAPGPLRDRTVSRIVAAVSACFSSAVQDDLRRDNPVSKAVMPRRDPVPEPNDQDEMDGQAKALTRAELAVFLEIVHPNWRVFFRLLAATGLRISEAIALDVRHLKLDGPHPHVKVRRAYGQDGMDRPKSGYGVRDVPLPHGLVRELREHLARLEEPPKATVEKWGRLAFPTSTGTPLNDQNLRRRVLRPATEEADASWAGFHAFRHAFASMHIERGTNIVRLSRLLGHHSPAFTLNVYGHMLDDGYGEPLALDEELVGATDGATSPTSLAQDASAPIGADSLV